MSAFAVAASGRLALATLTTVASPSVLLDQPTTALAWGKGGGLVCASADGIRLWQAGSLEGDGRLVVKSRQGESISLVTLDDVSDPPLVLHAVGSRVLVHDALTGTVIQTLEGSSTSSPVRDLSVGGDGHQVAVGHESGEILLHDLRSAADSSSRPQKIAGPSSLPTLALCRLHPHRPRTLVALVRDSADLLVYDTAAGGSSTRRSIPLGLRGRPTDLDFHPTGPHIAIVSDAGELVTVNLDSGGVRATQVEGRATAVCWSGRSSVLIGTDAGQILARDVQDAAAAKDHIVDSAGSPVVALRAQPLLVKAAPRSRVPSGATTSGHKASSGSKPSSDGPSRRPSSSLSNGRPKPRPSAVQPATDDEPPADRPLTSAASSSRMEGTAQDIAPAEASGSRTLAPVVPLRISPSSPTFDSDASSSPRRSIARPGRPSDLDPPPAGAADTALLLEALRDIQLEVIRSQRQTKLEMRALFERHSAELDDLRQENAALRQENERLRRGF